MKKGLIVIFTFLLLCEQVSAQVIQNAGFETGATTGWTFTNPAFYGFAKEPGYTASILKGKSAAGSYSAKLASTDDKSQWAQLKHTIAYKPSQDFELVRMSAFVKLTGVQGSAGISLGAFKADGVKLLVKDSGLQGNTDWTKISVDLILVKPADSLTFFCSLVGKGQVLFDQVSIEKRTLPKLEQSVEAKAYLDTALQIITTYALYKDSVDFPALLNKARMLASNAKTPADCYSAIEHTLTGLKDRHSFFVPAAVMNEPESPDDPISYPEGRLLGDNVGYVRVPAFGYENNVLKLKYADSLQRTIQSIDKNSIKGWIVDLRKNGGGQPYAMLLGIAPLLGEGVFIRSNQKGRWSDSISYAHGGIHTFNNGKDSVELQSAAPYSLYHPYPKVAILTDKRTASAAEMVTLSFKHRPNTKQFGEPTYGISTLPHFADLSDKAMIAVFAAKQTDRLGNVYGGKIYPDITLINDDSPTDNVMEAAVQWIRETP